MHLLGIDKVQSCPFKGTAVLVTNCDCKCFAVKQVDKIVRQQCPTYRCKKDLFVLKNANDFLK